MLAFCVLRLVCSPQSVLLNLWSTFCRTDAAGASDPVRKAQARDAGPIESARMATMLRFMVIDQDGRRVGRFETADPSWRADDIFALDEQMWRIVEILPEVSTMVAYNAVWVAAPAVDEDEQAALDGWPVPEAIRRMRV
jgi:hypothetical protein